MKVTIIDVATHAGVSKATVSRVINKNPNVNEEIRQKVLHSIEELGYLPNAFAKNLAKNTSNVFGLILPDITNPYFPILARGIEDASHRLGYSLFIANTDNNPDIEQEYIDKFISQQVAGIILISSSLDELKVKKLSELSIPFVLCDRFIMDSPFDTVSIDNYKASYEVVKHLINKGHKDICHLSGPLNVQSANRRKQGYVDAIKENDLEPCILYGDFNFESGYQLMKTILEDKNPSAVFAGNDLIALGAMNAIQEAGLTVPEDISVIGCDDILFAQMSRPKLSSISIPAYQIGVTAVDMMVDRIKGVSTQPRNLVLEHKFIERES
ncbi:LacI family DNA-binding transcriptional regulator [Fredinandcohnia humi]